MSYFLFLGLVLFVYMSLWFVLSVIKKRNDIADVAWGLGFVLLAWVSFFYLPETNLRSFIVTLLVTIWGTRLAWHIHKRNKGKKEDYRYAQWRKDWGKLFFVRSYLQVYMLQGILLFLIVLPVLMINKSGMNTFGIIDILGILIWATGFFFEVTGDWQLSQFIQNSKNKGALLTTGLWQYTRHPNYFGEVLLWWGILCLTISVEKGWLSIIGPITITVLILKVSGIPLLEKKMEQHPEFSAYKKRVSMFFPLPPKHN